MSKSNTEMLKTKFLQLMVITMEECGELIQECSKSMRRNDENHQPLKDEIGDVYCMIQLCKEYGIIDQKMLDERVEYKKNKLKKWSNLISEPSFLKKWSNLISE